MERTFGRSETCFARVSVLLCAVLPGGVLSPQWFLIFFAGVPYLFYFCRVPVPSPSLLVFGQVIFLPLAGKHHICTDILSCMFV